MQKLKRIINFLFFKHLLKTIIVSVIVSCILVISFLFFTKPEEVVLSNTIEITNYSRDLTEILKDGKLTVLVENSSVSFFVYKGRKMGFEYELLKEFANDLGVELEVKIINDLDQVIDLLNSGEGDILACNYTITKERSKHMDFSIPFHRTNQVLIQRTQNELDDLKEKNHLFLRDVSQLAGKQIHVREQSSFNQRLSHLQEEIGDTIFVIKESGKVAVEEMIEMVSEGVIDYTVSDANLAKINTRFYNNINIDLSLSIKQKIAFGLRKSSPALKARLDHWLEKYKHRAAFKYIKHKYFNLKPISSGVNKHYSSLKGGKISIYDDYFKEASAKTGWEWKLLASLCFQESRFNPNVVSFGGAYSMMQFMPEIGPLYGVFIDSPPKDQIMGGAFKLAKDFKSWSEIPDETQRKKFTIATYNSGKSHILDAQRLAKKYGLNPYVWDDNVEKMILNLSKREYYKDPVVKSGVAKGSVTYNYVREIFQRYEMWSSLYD